MTDRKWSDIFPPDDGIPTPFDDLRRQSLDEVDRSADYLSFVGADRERMQLRAQVARLLERIRVLEGASHAN